LTVVGLMTGVVVTVNVFESVFAAIVMDVGTEAELLSELRLMTKPPVGATPVSVTVPVDETLPRTLVGASVTEEIAGALTA
ncbi:hypothetical protein ABTN05_20735, partial [Acinetobacter baumannii]